MRARAIGLELERGVYKKILCYNAHMKRKSSIFNPGQRVEGTMLTIVGPVNDTTWMDIECVCDCGKKVILPYLRVYLKQFSCGCKRRIRPDAADHTGFTAVGEKGNHGAGRTLTVLYRDADSQQWVYLCHCCGETSTVPRGNERGLQNTLRRLANSNCPNCAGAFVDAFHANDRLSFTSGGGRMVGAECLARKLEARGLNKFVKRDYKGALEGFYVPSDGSFPQIRIEVSEMKAMVEREPELLKLGLTKPTEPPPVKQVIDEDAEGFAELDKTGAED